MPAVSMALEESWMGDRPLDVVKGLLVLLVAVGCGVASLHAARKKKVALTAGACAFALVSILLKHRTLWVVSLTVVTYLLGKYRFSFLKKLFLVLVVITCIFLAAWAMMSERIAESFITMEAALSSPFEERSTARWRVEGWRILLGRMRPVDFLTGVPLGTSFGREIYGSWREESAHNFYVTHVIYMGVFGLFTFVALLFYLWVKLRSMASHARDDPARTIYRIAELAVVTYAVFFMAYGDESMFGLVIGVLLALAGQGLRRPHDRAVTPQDQPPQAHLNPGPGVAHVSP
jgi:hypothetical protein